MSKWIEEELEPGLRISYGLKSVLSSAQSKFQTVDVVDLAPFGRTLLIDGLIQSCQVDEYVYHESLVHPALLTHPCPKTVYIGGGGEGSTAREVLRHSTVERCVMVDIDEDVVRFCREHLPENTEAFGDSRLELVLDDAKAILEQSPTKFDIIIMDLGKCSDRRAARRRSPSSDARYRRVCAQTTLSRAVLATSCTRSSFTRCA